MTCIIKNTQPIKYAFLIKSLSYECLLRRGNKRLLISLDIILKSDQSAKKNLNTDGGYSQRYGRRLLGRLFFNKKVGVEGV